MKAMLANHRDIAMQYSPNNLVFTISLVDGGTIDLIRGLGKNVVSSCDLVAQFEATLTDEQIKTHFAARDAIDAITAAAFQEIGRRVRNGGTHEYEMQQWFWKPSAARIWSPMIRRWSRSTPTAAIRTTSRIPETSKPIREGDFVLLDVWAKKNTPGAVYYDITWTGFVGKSPSDRMREVFEIVRQARDVGVKTVHRRRERRQGRSRDGKWTARCGITSRTPASSSISFIAPGIPSAPRFTPTAPTWTTWKFTTSAASCPTHCFSIEPGIYLPEFGVRSEVNMLVRPKAAEVTGKIQSEIVII